MRPCLNPVNGNVNTLFHCPCKSLLRSGIFSVHPQVENVVEWWCVWGAGWDVMLWDDGVWAGVMWCQCCDVSWWMCCVSSNCTLVKPFFLNAILTLSPHLLLKQSFHRSIVQRNHHVTPCHINSHTTDVGKSHWYGFRSLQWSQWVYSVRHSIGNTSRGISVVPCTEQKIPFWRIRLDILSYLDIFSHYHLTPSLTPPIPTHISPFLNHIDDPK